MQATRVHSMPANAPSLIITLMSVIIFLLYFLHLSTFSPQPIKSIFYNNFIKLRIGMHGKDLNLVTVFFFFSFHAFQSDISDKVFTRSDIKNWAVQNRLSLGFDSTLISSPQD